MGNLVLDQAKINFFNSVYYVIHLRLPNTTKQNKKYLSTIHEANSETKVFLNQNKTRFTSVTKEYIGNRGIHW